MDTKGFDNLKNLNNPNNSIGFRIICAVLPKRLDSTCVIECRLFLCHQQIVELKGGPVKRIKLPPVPLDRFPHLGK